MNLDDIQARIKSVPPIVWVVGAGVLLLFFVMGRGGGSSGASPSGVASAGGGGGGDGDFSPDIAQELVSMFDLVRQDTADRAAWQDSISAILSEGSIGGGGGTSTTPGGGGSAPAPNPTPDFDGGPRPITLPTGPAPIRTATPPPTVSPTQAYSYLSGGVKTVWGSDVLKMDAGTNISNRFTLESMTKVLKAGGVKQWGTGSVWGINETDLRKAAKGLNVNLGAKITAPDIRNLYQAAGVKEVAPATPVTPPA